MKPSLRSVVATIGLVSLILPGCKRPPEAPAELDDLSKYLYREWDNEDPEVLAVGLDNLRAFLQDVDMEGAVLERSWELTSIASTDVAGVPHPADRNPEDTLGVAVTSLSQWPVRDHAMLQIEPDQTITEPAAAFYERSFLTDDACFPGADCKFLETSNQVTRDNLVMSVDMVLYKNFRWVSLEGGDAVISRSYLDQSWVGTKGKSTIWQSFSIDVWIPQGNKTLRFQTLWSESDVANASDKLLIGTVKSSTDNIYDAGDEAIETLFH